MVNYEKLAELLKDENFRKELEKADSAESAQKLFAAKDFEISIDDLNKIRTQNASGELSEADLATVAGGSGGSDAANEVKDFFKTLFTGW